MTSSTFNFKLYLAALYAVLLGFFGLAVLSAISKPIELLVRGSSPYRFREQIDAIHPDLILVGNSHLWASVDRNSLEKQLSEKVGRPIKLCLFADGGTPISWMYLVLKNHVVKSGAKNTAVGVFDIGSELVSFNRNLTTRKLWLVYKLLQPDDSVFFQKTGVRQEQLRWLGRAMDMKFELANFLTARWSRLFWLMSDKKIDPFSVLNGRFKFPQQPGSDRLKFQQQKPSEDGCDDFERCADQTFLPEMIDVMKQNRLFFVEVHPRPGTERATRAPASFARYLQQRGIPLISMADKKEFNDIRLYGEGHHLAPNGTAISARLFAEECVRMGLVSSKKN